MNTTRSRLFAIAMAASMQAARIAAARRRARAKSANSPEMPETL